MICKILTANLTKGKTVVARRKQYKICASILKYYADTIRNLLNSSELDT